MGARDPTECSSRIILISGKSGKWTVTALKSRLRSGFHDNPASHHPEPKWLASRSKARFRGFRPRSSAFRFSPPAEGIYDFPEPVRSLGPPSLWASLLVTSLPGRVFPGRCWPPGTDLRSPAACRSGESPAGPGSGGTRASSLLPSAGSSSAAVPRAETASGASPGGGGAG
ncbi:hypothetical protein P7K49_009887 [Saguinus oedipus]|uniref:Uncharacterized protein n=1 Tax=Saguinus oedipus TaxID=9490 RepID=A0ABQ9VL84_SAGOE|nr:hypothetical protein P7K49_009887 [Saguinus oedipus]